MSMSISGVSGYSNYNFTNYQSTGSYGSNTATSSYSSTQEVQQSNGRPDGPPPPPKGGGGKGGQMNGPDLDTDGDSYWDEEEINAYASFSSEELGITVDTDSIISAYDTDKDGKISSEERVAMGKDNAFNLPSPNDMMQQMRGFSQPPQIQQAATSSNTASDGTDETNLQMIQQLIEAYNQQNTSLYKEMYASSSLTYQV